MFVPVVLDLLPPVLTKSADVVRELKPHLLVICSQKYPCKVHQAVRKWELPVQQKVNLEDVSKIVFLLMELYYVGIIANVVQPQLFLPSRPVL
jgi:hypothetical protein